jgi:hypothetical protein
MNRASIYFRAVVEFTSIIQSITETVEEFVSPQKGYDCDLNEITLKTRKVPCIYD